MMFAAWICRKTTIEKDGHFLAFKKVAIFGQKLWTNPFGKLNFFSCLNRILFYLGHQKMMFAAWICRKTTIEKDGHFLAFKKVAIFGQKLWTNPFGKFDFLEFFF